ncbi:MAG TPA: hypothetical protein VMY88_03025 [Acidimicrobiales bacterium]|nr:hypothetical protein [Acidimicrobiales bacterium]
MKFALLRNTIKGHAGWLGVGLAYGVSIIFGVAAGALLLLSRGAGGGATEGVSLAIPTVLFLGWLIGPIMTTGFDSTIDPSKLATYPLTSRQMTVGLFAVACLGGGGVFSLLAVAGLVGAVAPASPLALVSFAAGLSVVGVSVAASRAVAALISGASRRVRDTLLFVVPLVFTSIGVLPQLLNLAEDDQVADLGRLAPAAKLIATALPSGPPAQALLAASQGKAAASLLWLAGGVVWIGVMLWLWSLALRRMLVRAVSAPAAGARDRQVTASRALYWRVVNWLPRTRVGAVAAKELRLTTRDPRQRAALLGSVVGAVPFALMGLSQPGPSAVLRVSAVAFFVGATSTNLYGYDGASHWMNVAAGDDARADLRGKCLGRALIGGTLVLLLVALTATLTGYWSLALPAMALGVAGLGLGLGPAAWVSVAYPWPMPPAQKNVFAGANTGQGMQAFVPLLILSLVGGLVLFGLGSLMARDSRSAVQLLLLSALAVAIGVGAFAIGMTRAIVRSRDRQPELLLALTKA